MPATKRRKRRKKRKKRKKPPRSVDLSNVILAGALEGAKAILPEESLAAHARINAARERLDGRLESAGRERAALMRQADRADRMGDGPRAASLRKQAHDVFKAAQDEATAALLDAMAQEYISPAAVFNHHTLEVLRRTAVGMYGGVTGDRLHEWRARWWELKAAAAAATPGPADTPASPARRGYRREMKEYMKKHELATQQIAAKNLGVGLDTLKTIMSNKGKLRCSEETLDRVLKRIRATPAKLTT